MATDLFANLAQTTITSGGTTAPAPGTTESWTPSNPASFPVASPAASPPTQFRITDPALPAERITVTDSRTVPWTVVRGAEGTTPVAHAPGFTIQQVVTAGALTAMVQNPMTTPGDLLYGGASGAPARLAGDTSNNRKFLRTQASGGTAQPPAWDTLQAGDIPQLAQYNPAGLTGATTPTSYAGGTVSGHPLSGAWTQGQWVVSQDGRLWACVAGGTPGTWRRVDHDPWQFFLDDYCTGDLKEALVTVTSAAPTVINTTPIATPPAPTMANSGTGGTILAGVYQAVITYVNRWGETVASSAASTTTAGSTSTITITPPGTSLAGNATGWKLYMTGPGGATFFLQGGVQALNVPVTLTAPPVTSGSQPPASDSSAAQVFTSTAVDGGKDFIIQGGTGTVPTAPCVGHIATVVSPTQATITVTNGTPIIANATGAAFAFATDDRLNVDQCISDAAAYATNNNYICHVIGGARVYSVGQNFFQSKAGGGGGSTPGEATYNTQVRIPFPSPSGNTRKLDFHLLFPGDSGFNQFWGSQTPDLSSGFFSFGIGNNGADPNYGNASIVGGPAAGASSVSNGFFNTKVTVKGMQTWHPGWDNTIGLDLVAIGGCRVVSGSSFAFAPSTTYGGQNGAVNPYDQWITNTFWQARSSMGIRTPAKNDNEDSIIESYAVGGLNRGIDTPGEGLNIGKYTAISCQVAFGIEGPGGNPNHGLNIQQLHWENCLYGIYVYGGSTANWLSVNIGAMDSEGNPPNADIYDPNNVLRGVIRWYDTFRNPAVPTLTGAKLVNIINGTLGPAVVPPVAALTDAATIAVEADLGNDFRVTLTATGHTIGNPANPQDGQEIRLLITQPAAGGPYTVTWGSAYSFGASGAPTLSTAASKTDIIRFAYNATLTKWLYLGSTLGF